MIARVTDQVKDEAWRLPPAGAGGTLCTTPFSSTSRSMSSSSIGRKSVKFSYPGLRDHDRVFVSQVQVLLGHPAFSGLR